MRSALLDTDTLSEIMKPRPSRTIQLARAYLNEHPRLAFSLITRYEVLRGIRWRRAAKQEREFEAQCRDSWVVNVDHFRRIEHLAIESWG